MANAPVSTGRGVPGKKFWHSFSCAGFCFWGLSGMATGACHAQPERQSLHTKSCPRVLTACVFRSPLVHSAGLRRVPGAAMPGCEPLRCVCPGLDKKNNFRSGSVAKFSCTTCVAARSIERFEGHERCRPAPSSSRAGAAAHRVPWQHFFFQ